MYFDPEIGTLTLHEVRRGSTVSLNSAWTVLLLWATALGACNGQADVRPQLDAAEELIAVLQLTDADEPSEVTSKTVRYASTTGLAAGDVDTVVASIEERLQKKGWSIMTFETLNTAESPSRKGGRLVATRDSLVAQAAIFAQIGINPAPEGFAWVQVQVATVDDELAWIESP